MFAISSTCLSVLPYRRSGSATVVARSSPYALYDQTLASFGESGGEFSQDASPGFIELFTLQSRLAHRVRARDDG